ncbi:islet cell autoantigen 1-like isoform X1 [Megalops cyprinoides]|uniref:islet cell autoantigen 1-like isoform X1 n=1 Tax=Megalops cyprinoides TaxID=118141 RepID=UPI0018640AB8|nr:islet cell autoantigen 1-like isoform X1 [Megalops cyprinoides]XP_036396859.1 islet cell autoantigen 1-like isoform X1 [Megalops cyprinoides]XP_036396860.1 islet cell autoantigen 1-like isoform X1 [Megalops cyprinoides]XP_036396862.1 islet cell autoantigen 1-like isoform X1 [Megalops cyprinoides]
MDSGYGFSSDMFSGRAVLGEDSSVMARMQKKFWKTKQVLIKATGKKEDEYVVASDADLDAKLEFFRSVQATCTELLKVIEKYQERITHLSQEENELGLFLRFQAEHDRTKAGNMMDATSKALCTSAKQRLALCAPLQRMEQEVETFRRRAITDTLLTVGRMEKARTEYRGALLWMKDVSQELDPDTYKQLEKFRKVQAQVRSTKGQFEKLKNDVCQKVDMLGASRCNMLSHSLTTYQTTLLHFWEKTAPMMAGIHETFKGYVPYQFTTLKDLRDPLEHLTEGEKQEKNAEGTAQKHTDKLISLEEDKAASSATDAVSTHSADGQSRDSDSSLCASLDSALCELTGPLSAPDTDDDLLLMTPDPTPLPPPHLPPPTAPPAAGMGFIHSPPGGALEPIPTTSSGQGARDLLLDVPQQKPAQLQQRQQQEEEEDGERADLSFLQEILSPGPAGSNEFSREWQDAFGCFESPPAPAPAPAPAAPALSPSHLSSPSGFLPSQLLDQSLSSTGWATPPMFQAPPLQPPQSTDQAPPTQSAPKMTANVPAGSARDMSAWFNLFADLDPLSNPDAIGRSDDELLTA